MDYEKLKTVFQKFYYRLLNHPYYRQFFNSFSMVDSLIETRQVTSFIKLIDLIEEGKKEEAYEICVQIANIHSKLNISAHFIFEGIKLLKKIINETNDIKIREETLEELFYLLEKSTASVYIKSLLKEGISMIKTSDEWQMVQKRNLENLLSALEKGYIPSVPITCPLNEFLNSLEFQIKTSIDKKDRYKIQLYHNFYHDLLERFWQLYTKEMFLDATVLVEDLVNTALLLNSFLEEVQSKWMINKKRCVVEYFMETASISEIKIIPEENKNLINDFILEKLFKFLDDTYKNERDIFIFKDYKEINIISEKKSKDEIYEKIKEFCQDFCLLKDSLIKVAKLDISPHYKKMLDNEVISEILNIITQKIREINKEDGNMVFVYDFTDEMDKLIKEARENIKIKNLVIDAVKNRSITPFLHEIVDIRTLEPVGAEILARIFDDESPIPAYKFLPIIEEKGLTVDFDISILTALDNKLREFPYKNIFVNFFPTSLELSEIVEKIINLSKKARRHKKILTVEITEHNLMEHTAAFEKLAKEKVSIAFDDFGVGYTNFELVGKLVSVSYTNIIKVDGNIVKNIDSPVYRSILRAISVFANENNIDIVFEFIENEKILNQIKEITADLKVNVYGQGSYFSKPHPLI